MRKSDTGECTVRLVSAVLEELIYEGLHCTAPVLPEGGNQQPKLLCLQKTFWEKRVETMQRITSPRGIHLRFCRSIQVEGAFVPKNLWMKRENMAVSSPVSLRE